MLRRLQRDKANISELSAVTYNNLKHPTILSANDLTDNSLAWMLHSGCVVKGADNNYRIAPKGLGLIGI